MRHTPERHTVAADRTVKDIRRKTRKRYSSEDKIRIVLAGLRGEEPPLERFWAHYSESSQLTLRYAKIYPFAEGGAGVLMIAGALGFISIPVALFIGGLGAYSVFKAVYIDKRELRCACVGGNSNVPLGFVSLTENIMMVAMAVWMLLK